MPENIVQIIRREFISLDGKEKLELGDIIKVPVESKGELVINACGDMITTLKVGRENGEVVPIKTYYQQIKKLSENGMLGHLNVDAQISGLYIKVNEGRWDINVEVYFDDYRTITKSKLKAIGF